MVLFLLNFIGSAFLVKNRQDDAFYVAKKMMLDGMGEKDKASAWGEVHRFINNTDLNSEKI